LPLPLPMPTQPDTLTATRVATSAIRSFFIGIPSAAAPCDQTQWAPIATRITAVELVLKSHSADPTERAGELISPIVSTSSGFSIANADTDVVEVLQAPATSRPLFALIRLTKLHRSKPLVQPGGERRGTGPSLCRTAAVNVRRYHVGSRRPPSFRRPADPGQPDRSGLPPRPHPSGFVARARRCARVRPAAQ
jgi:hypothetical protein